MQQGRGSLTFTIRLYKHNYPSDEGLVYRSTGRADGGFHVILIANVTDCISEMNNLSSVLSNGSRTDFRCYQC